MALEKVLQKLTHFGLLLKHFPCHSQDFSKVKQLHVLDFLIFEGQTELFPDLNKADVKILVLSGPGLS